MDWRTWLYEQATATGVLEELGGRVYQTLDHAPVDRPFMVIRLEETSRNVGRFQTATFWIHDNPGSYLVIDALHAELRALIEGQVSEEGAIAVEWQGEGPDLSDDARGTVVRSATYRLVGRDS